MATFKTCKELFKNIDHTIIGDADIAVSGLAYSSNAVEQDNAFFCIVGLKSDGHNFAEDAVLRGATVIVCERELPEITKQGTTVVLVDDTRKAMAAAACAFYDYPSSSFKFVGITGTNGKTTTTYLVEEIGARAGMKTGVIGTVGMKIGDEIVEDSGRTTPESIDLQRMLAKMRDAGCELVAMEVSSHALDLKRVWGCDFDVCAFTNLSQDHLDYHKTFEAYFEAKAKLFGGDYPATRVIGTTNEWGARLKDIATGKVLTYGFEITDDICASSIEYSAQSSKFNISFEDNIFPTKTPLVGKFNVENAMCAFGIGVALGISPEKVVAGLGSNCCVPGRLQSVLPDEHTSANLPAVFVDYAHTPDALEKAISTLRELTPGRLLVLFGCGGDRDREKRPLMGEISLAADYVVVTSDNPRTEEPKAILDDILAGMTKAQDGQLKVIEDRAEAIKHIVDIGAFGDVILLAGKGHEDYQEGKDGKIHFDDREHARAALEAYVSKK